MSALIRYQFAFPPSTNHLFANAGKGRIKSEGYRRWIKGAQGAILEQGRKRQPGPVSLSLALVRPDNRKRDLSNAIKSVEDLLVGMGVIEDDSLVQRLSVQWVPSGAPCTVLIQPAEMGLAA